MIRFAAMVPVAAAPDTSPVVSSSTAIISRLPQLPVSSAWTCSRFVRRATVAPAGWLRSSTVLSCTVRSVLIATVVLSISTRYGVLSGVVMRTPSAVL